MIGRHWTEVDTPVLLVDLDRLQRNIERMAALARAHGVALRPHVKTHKSTAIARMQIDAGAVGLTAAKLDEAEVFANAGFSDLFIAYQLVSPAKLQRAIDLAARCTLPLASIRSQESTSPPPRVPVPEPGSGCASRSTPGCIGAASRPRTQSRSRSGSGRIQRWSSTASSPMPAMRTPPNRRASWSGSARRRRSSVLRAAELIGPVGSISVGNTPTAARSIAEPGVTEARPGNYVFYDGMQVALGAAGADDCALTVAATVISRPAADRAVVDAGAKTLGLDRGAHGSSSLPHYGSLVETDGAVVRLSEEHGVVELAATSSLGVGDPVRILPNHACAVANLAAGYAVVRGGRVVDWWPVDAAGAVH